MFALVIVLSTGFFGYTYDKEKVMLLKDVDDKLYTSAIMLRSVVGEDYHDNLKNNTFSPEEYDRIIVDRNNHLCEELGLQYLWSNLVVDGNIVFTTSTSPSHNVTKKDHAHFFEVHRDPAAFEEVLRNKNTTYSSFKNEWGYGRMVLVPFTDRNGRTYIFGASIGVNEIYSLLQKILYEGIIFLLIGIIIGAVISFIIAWMLSRRLTLLKEAAILIDQKKDFNIKKIKDKDEIGDLALILKRMIHKIKEAQLALEHQKNNLNKQVKQRTKELKKKNSELEKFTKLSVGRELELVELKKKMREKGGNYR